MISQFHPSENKNELKRFISLPWEIYKNDPHWVPLLRLQVLEDLDTKKNPFYKHAEICLWNAYENGCHVGRIAAIHDKRHNEFHGENIGFFGFFECVNNPSIAKQLLAVAEEWVLQRGLDGIRGPANPSFNHSVGIQISAFERDPYVMMTHNPPYYVDLLEQANFQKKKDLLAYEMYSNAAFPERMIKLAERVNRKNRITYRSLNMKKFSAEIDIIREIYNSAWEKNWGFVPMDEEEFTHMANSMKDVLWADFCLIAEIDAKPIAFSITLPDINQVLKTIPDGKLLPFGIFKLLLGLRKNKGKINQARVITLGVRPEYRATGVASVLFYETYRRAPSLGVLRGEMSWILEDNIQMRGAAELMGGSPYKTYRIYEKQLVH